MVRALLASIFFCSLLFADDLLRCLRFLDGKHRDLPVLPSQEHVTVFAQAPYMESFPKIMVASCQCFDGFERGGVHNPCVIELEIDI
jgi:hypothetical protein